MRRVWQRRGRHARAAVAAPRERLPNLAPSIGEHVGRDSLPQGDEKVQAVRDDVRRDRARATTSSTGS